MDGWIWLWATGGGDVLWLVVKWLFISPTENKFNELAGVYLDKQAQKRHGTVTMVDGMPALTIPYKTATIVLHGQAQWNCDHVGPTRPD